VLNDYGIQRDHATGSYYIFRDNLNGQNLRMSIPSHQPIKVIFVKEAVVIIDQIRAEQKEGESDD
jgi:hypothetical protein